MFTTSEIKKVTQKIKQELVRKPRIKKDYVWGCESLNIIDAVLSLNRNYKSFVVPRILSFKNKYPKILNVEDLIKLRSEYKSTYDFVREELKYNDRLRSKVLGKVMRKMLKIKDKHGSLNHWAMTVGPEDCVNFNVDGIGLAGFQYLRMLFGAQTVKPDIYIKRFIQSIIKRSVSDSEAIVIMELSGLVLNWPIREIDNNIWQKYSNSGI